MKVRVAIPVAVALFLSWGVGFGQGSPQAQLHADRGLQLMREGNLAAAEAELRQAVQLRPHDPTLLAELGVVLGMEQKLGESDHYFQEALRFDPSNVSIRRNLAKNQWRLGEFKSAEANLQTALKVQPGDGESTLILGMVEENLQHFATAAHLLNSVPELAKQHPEAIAALARSYYRLHKPSGARQTLRGLLQAGAPAEALYLGGQTALEADDYALAEELLAAAQPGYPGRAKLGYFLALSRYRGGKFRACQDTILDTLKTAPATRELEALLGWCYAQQDMIEEAANAFNQAVALDPSQESTYLDLGTVLLDHHRDELALGLGKETAKRFPNSYRALMLRGTAESRLGFLTDAIKSFARAVELNPHSPEANYNLAVMQSLAGFANEALGTLEKGIEKFPRDALHYQEFASLQVQLAEGGNAQADAQAYSALRKALSLDNHLAESHLLLGRVELKDNRAQQAVSELETAAKLDPKDAAVHLMLSRAYARLGMPDKAAQEAETYKTMAQAELHEAPGHVRVVLRRW